MDAVYRQVKARAKQALTGNVGVALGVLLFPAILIVLFGLLTDLFRLLFALPDWTRMLAGGMAERELPGVLFGHAAIVLVMGTALFLLLAPITVGCYRWFFLLAQGNLQPIGQIFCCFETARSYRRTLWLVLNVQVRKVAVLLLGLAPGVAVLAVAAGLAEGMPWLLTLGIRLLGVFLSLYGLGVSFTYSRKYLLVYYLADGGERPCRELLRESADRMRGQRLNTAVLYLRFVPALLCCVLLVPALYVLPSFGVTLGCWVDGLLGADRACEN